MTRNKLHVLSLSSSPSLSSYFRFKLKLCCILRGAWGMLARQHIVIQLLFVIETQRSAARIVVSFRRAEKRLFLTLADRLFVRLSAAKEEKQLKMKLKTFRLLLLPLSDCAFRPACSIWQKNKRKATRATKTTVGILLCYLRFPSFPLLRRIAGEPQR